jgi:hypothetical protein
MKGVIGGFALGMAGFITLYGVPAASRNSVGVQVVALILFILGIVCMFYGICELASGK